jgi:hypothetical protein
MLTKQGEEKKSVLVRPAFRGRRLTNFFAFLSRTFSFHTGPYQASSHSRAGQVTHFSFTLLIVLGGPGHANFHPGLKLHMLLSKVFPFGH